MPTDSPKLPSEAQIKTRLREKLAGLVPYAGDEFSMAIKQTAEELGVSVKLVERVYRDLILSEYIVMP